MVGAPVRVLVVSHVSSAWGAQLRLLEQAPHLTAEGIELALAAPAGGTLPARWTELGLRHVPLPLPEHRGLRPAGRGGGRPSVLALGREVGVLGVSSWREARRARPYEVVHSHSLDAHLEVALAGRLARRPVVLDLHDLVVEGVGRKVLAAAGRLATAVIANSSATAALVPADRTTVIHPGVDLTRFHPGPASPELRAAMGATSDDDVLVGILGRLDPEKGIELLAEAMAGAGPGGARLRLVVVGAAALQGDAYEASLRARLGTALGERVRFLGRRGHVPDLMRALDVVVNANEAEPFGRTILEAQASGTAVVAMAGGGVPDFVADGVTGLLVAPGDRAALGAALAGLAEDVELRHRLADAGRRQAQASFSLEGQCRRVAEVYRRVAGRG